ncbi:MAG: hypothetical protein HY076_04205 [Candidatus Eisenbacteria bacterium]|uniref:Uncharacterized protein n=1 Tax=Eiseniibacteriota bacterium TaxID=2212470 RepID=A0A9D6L619_UNCEI|nr:hypothetical protein [Candidatus Eisenbacteria bacterium]MBI3539456.1 hypothetical protein [Candidatus Eisenbacteria bacterium]
MLLGLVFALDTSGCTAAGYSAGARLDHQLGRSRDPGTLVTLRRGAVVELALRDGGTRRGTLLGVRDQSAPEYETRYAQWRPFALVGRVPGIGDSITLQGPGDPRSGRFAAFVLGGVLVSSAGDGAPVTVRYSEFDSLRGPDLVLAAATLGHRDSLGQLPLRTVALIEVKDGTLAIPLDRIAHVERDLAAFRMVGTIVGLGLDVLVIHEIFKQPPRPKDTCAAPPGIY